MLAGTATMSAQGMIDRAISSYVDGDLSSFFRMHRIDGHVDNVSVSSFLSSDNLSAAEGIALKVCEGTVLDIGAGMGRHSVILRDRGFQVTPLDVSRECVSYLRAQGFVSAIQADINSFSGQKFDTLLMLGNGIGAFGSLSNLRSFLLSLDSKLNPGGTLIVDSTDISRAGYLPLITAREDNRSEGRDAGVIDFIVEFDGSLSEPLSWLYLTESELKAIVQECGLQCEVLYRGVAGVYVASISARRPGQSSALFRLLKLGCDFSVGEIVPSEARASGDSRLRAQFHEAGYAVVRKAVPENVCRLVESTSLLELRSGGSFTIDGQAHCPSVYGGGLGDALLEMLRPMYEEICGCDLLPTYSFMRIYLPGASLARHVDRPSCEVSATLTIGRLAGESWPIFVEANGQEIAVPLEVGDAMIYKGAEVPHWRTAFEGTYWIQLFFHYVKQDGDHAQRVYDGRGGLGLRRV